jgi:hypothetical protein
VYVHKNINYVGILRVITYIYFIHKYVMVIYGDKISHLFTGRSSGVLLSTIYIHICIYIYPELIWCIYYMVIYLHIYIYISIYKNNIYIITYTLYAIYIYMPYSTYKQNGYFTEIPQLFYSLRSSEQNINVYVYAIMKDIPISIIRTHVYIYVLIAPINRLFFKRFLVVYL